MDNDFAALGSRYELQESIGQGASGQVWRAWDRRQQTPVAAKLLLPQLASDPEILTRFIAERTILTGLTHPHIVRVHDLVAEGDRLAIIMDLVSGPSLATLLNQVGTIAPVEVVPIMAAILDGLAYAHSQLVVHRDIKPDNVLLTRGDRLLGEDVRIVDFGIAWLAHSGSGEERIGTPAYMAPELLLAGTATPASDIYAAGTLFYQLLAGRTPFSGAGDDERAPVSHQLRSAPPRLGVDERLWQILAAMLTKTASQRPSASEAAASLRALPGSALAASPLPIQSVPEAFALAPDAIDWDEASAEKDAGGLRIRVRKRRPKEAPAAEPAEIDPFATSLKAGRPLATPTEELEDPTTLTPPGDDPFTTQLKSGTGPGPMLVSEPQPAPRKRRWPIVVGGSVAVAALTAGVLAALGVFSATPPEEDPIALPLPAHSNGSPTKAGLRLDLSASYQELSELSQLDITAWAPPGQGLMGDFLLTIPAVGAGAQTCAQIVEATHDYVPISASAHGVALSCSYQFKGLTIPAGNSQTVSLQLEQDLTTTDGSAADFSQWLADITSATDASLAQVSGTAFPLQRVESIAITAQSLTLDAGGGTVVPYSVFAHWAGDDATSPDTQILADTTLDGMETEVLLALTGGLGLDAVDIDSCNETQRNGIRVLAMQPTSSCELTAKVGALDSARTSFAINMRTTSQTTDEP